MSAEPALAFGPFLLDRAGGRLLRDGVVVELAPRPFAVLACLVAQPGVLVSKDTLLDAVWGHRHVSDSVLKVAVNALRAALGEDAKAPQWVATVARRGYRFSAAVQVLADAASPLVQRPHAPAGNLPGPGPALVGRAADAQALAAALGDPGLRLLTLCGPAGVGKTRLALAGAAHAAPADGVWLLRLDMLDDAAQLAPAVAHTLGLPSEAGRDDASLARALAPLRLRLLFDNAEHLADALAPRLVQWLTAAPGLQMLLTSQRALRVAGERLLVLAPLAVADAVALFVQRVQERQPGWLADSAARLDAGAIAQALDGLPLALELAAARVPLLGTAGVRQRMDTRLQLLTQGAADAPDRHRTLRTALEWSVGLLPPVPARLLEVLSVFVGGFSVAAVQAVMALHTEPLDEWATLDALQALRDLSLLVPAETASAGTEPRLRLLDSVRRLAAERLAARGAEAAAVLAHRAWLLALFDAADARAQQCGELAWLAPLAPETDNLAAAMARALPGGTHADATRAAQLFSVSVTFCLRAGLKLSALRWLEVLRRGDALPSPVPARLALAIGVLGALGQMLPPLETLPHIEAAAEGLLAEGDRRRAFYALYHRALLLQRLGRPAEAESAVAAMHALLDAGSSLYERRLPAWIEAVRQRDRGDIATYGAFWSDMLAQSRALGDLAEGWRAAWGLAQTLYLQDRLDPAIELIDRAVDEMRAAGRLRAQSSVAAQAAMLRLARDASPDTLVRVHEAVQLLRSDGMVWWLADALPWLAVWQGRAADARRLQAWADGLVAQRGEPRGPVFARLRQAFAQHLPGSAETVEALPDEDAALALAFGASALLGGAAAG